MEPDVARRRADAIVRKLTSLGWHRGQLANSIPETNGVYRRFELCKRSAWLKAHPRVKRVPRGDKFERDPAVVAAAAEFRVKSDAIWGRWQAALRRWLSEAQRLAQVVPLRVTGEGQWVELTAVSSGDYGSQGWGAAKYAEADATRRLRTVLAHLPPEYASIESTESSHKYFDIWQRRECISQNIKYRVLVRVEPVDLCWLDWKPGLSLRETVKLLWKRGCQPRVLFPMLPPEYERQNGLDYFGNDLPGWSGSEAVDENA